MTNTERQLEIKKKGFNMNIVDGAEEYSNNHAQVSFSKMKVGTKTLEDAVLNLSSFQKLNPTLGDKDYILNAIEQSDLPTLREISNFFYKTSGIYKRLCGYMANLYRYDWMLTPYVNSDKMKEEDVLIGFNKALSYLDNLGVKLFCNEAALKTIQNGSYFGYIIFGADGPSVQELPVNYCRTQYSIAGKPAIEFNMKYFDDMFRDTEQRMRVLSLFPEEFKKGYVMYKSGKLPTDIGSTSKGTWYLLEPDYAFKFNLGFDDAPYFISIIPAIIDLDAAKEIDRQKMQQQLLKVIIQTLPIDKNGDLVFDIDEGRELHNNVVAMLGKAIGIDVLTTFADVEVADMSESGTSRLDELIKVERSIYNEAGVSQMQFNTDGNLALTKSVANDEAALYTLVMQFERFLNDTLLNFNKNKKKICYKVQILPTTIYNFQEMAGKYKEQTQLGYSMMLPQVALGQCQSAILANAFFEQKVLHVNQLFIPPMSTSTMNADALRLLEGKDGEAAETSGKDNSKGGRPALEDDQKSDKTIANAESAN